MKILAIRGRNLASLAGDFEVDFQQEPLYSSGLFAITGATGAGKAPCWMRYVWLYITVRHVWIK